MTENQRPSEHEAQKSSWYLLTGFLLGLAIGLILAFVVLPVNYTDVAPQSLAMVDKDQYRLMIARVYAVDQNLTRAESRLELLGDDDIVGLLAAQSQQVLASGEDPAYAQALAALATAIITINPPNP